LIIVAGALVALDDQWKVTCLILLCVSINFHLVFRESFQGEKTQTFGNICLGVSGGLFILRFVIKYWGSTDLALDFIAKIRHRVALKLKVYV
jgi:hypothetical protein